MTKLSGDFYTRSDTIAVARDLLGKLLVVPDENGARVSGMIVETEAYLGAEDKACHSYKNRRTPRTETMFCVGGTVYVTFIYGMYFQFNVVTGAVDSPHAVLIRAVEPFENIEMMRTRRGVMKDGNLTSGPGKLCVALAIDKRYNKADLLDDKIWIEDFRAVSDTEIVVGKRIGIDYAAEDAEKPWRFWIKDNNFVSQKNRG